MKKSYAKKALLLSVLSIFLCVALLAGATFAWFTDSVTSDVTTIIAGVLDIEMEHMNTSTNGVYVDANSAELFEDVEKWEPGVVTVENLKIKNVGDLALEYRLSATFSNANTVVDVNGNDTGKTLADALKIAFLEGETISLPTNDKAAREAVLAKARPLGTPLKETVYEGSLLGYVESTQPTKDVAVVIYWDPTATDNDFNLQNGKTASVGNELKIDLGIKLVAPQKDYETDSFDMDYDIEASVYKNVGTEAELAAALASGENVPLTEEMYIVAATTAPYGNNKYGIKHDGTILDGGGNTITFDCYSDDYGIMTSGGTIQNITVEGVARGIVSMKPNQDVILKNVTIKNNVLYPFNTTEHATVSGVDIIATDCTFGGWASFGGVDSASFTNCDFVVGNYGYGWPYETFLRPYVTTTFDSCTFAVDDGGNGYYIDLSALAAGCKVTFKNCTVNGTVVDATNYATLFGKLELPSGRTIDECVIFA